MSRFAEDAEGRIERLVDIDGEAMTAPALFARIADAGSGVEAVAILRKALEAAYDDGVADAGTIEIDSAASIIFPLSSAIGEAVSLATRVLGGAVYRHKERGSTYTLVGQGRFQTSNGKKFEMISDDERLVAYRGEGGELSFRTAEGFYDGRFERVGGDS